MLPSLLLWNLVFECYSRFIDSRPFDIFKAFHLLRCTATATCTVSPTRTCIALSTSSFSALPHVMRGPHALSENLSLYSPVADWLSSLNLWQAAGIFSAPATEYRSSTGSSTGRGYLNWLTSAPPTTNNLLFFSSSSPSSSIRLFRQKVYLIPGTLLRHLYSSLLASIDITITPPTETAIDTT